MVSTVERGTRERILQVAEASLGEYGYNGTRLHRIAERVGIQKASLFHYFPSKERLYHAVLEEGFDETEQTIRSVLAATSSRLERLRGLIEAYVQIVAAHPDRTKIFLRQSLGDKPADYHPANSERVLRVVTTFIEDGQREGLFAPIDPLALVLSVIGMVAFFFTSVPVLAPSWTGDPLSPSSVERIQRHVADLVERCLVNGVTAAEAVHEARAAR